MDGTAKRDRYVEGFLAGQAVAYCERVRTGLSIAAQLVCPSEYSESVVKLIAEENCKVLVEPHEPDRTSLWIFRDELAERLIRELQSSQAPSSVNMWAMGKLLGYANHEVRTFIEKHAT